MDPAYGDDCPILAAATPRGESALALIRASGKGAVDLAAAVFSRPRTLQAAPGNSVVYGWIVDPRRGRDAKIDEVLVSVYRGSRSFTGEEGVDICCHGGIGTVKAVLSVLRNAGFRDALPGEFSFRAFMNGKLDLTRAESVMELVFAKTDRSREHAVNRLSGALEAEIREIKTLLVRVLAGTEIYLDYSEDEFAGADPGGLTGDDEAAGRMPDRALAGEALARLRVLADSYGLEKLYREGALVVIAGRPNAGKSSLFNRLLKEDRAIVTDIPGTTRDWIEAWVSLAGIPIRLADTAGIHAAEDPVERIGVARSRELLGEADLILHIIDGVLGFTGEDRAFYRKPANPSPAPDRDKPDPPVIALWNKADAAPLPGFLPELLAAEGAVQTLGISAKTGEGLPALITAAAAALEARFHGAAGENSSPGLGSERQKELIDRAIENLSGALALADRAEPLDLIAPLLREGVNALGEITGEVSTADILEAMFSRFCVGK
ncbi:MAG: tRNA uridine-5-carboxymethylaminomethyl(34) synthesis GTPase MnmE [Spirochaetaceae bacterium]|jgi:tRNA modification GTPase|nr:tRNA uridine-5-carboxymethylaminomethyl(34) synthesis GTPase MnmE [Spirochaetaceae bacterium]